MLKYLLIVTLFCALTQGSIYNWEELPYDNDNFNSRAEFNTDVTLYCNETGNRIPDIYDFKYWVRPDLEIMRNGDNETFHTPLDGEAGWEVQDTAMHIMNVQGEHFGFYLCVVHADGLDYIIKKAVNYRGPHFTNLWDDYEDNVIVACSAAGGLIVIIIVIYVVNMFYYDPKKHNNRSGSGSLDLSQPGTSDEGSIEMKEVPEVDVVGIEPMESGMENAIDQIFDHQKVRY